MFKLQTSEQRLHYEGRRKRTWAVQRFLNMSKARLISVLYIRHSDIRNLSLCSSEKEKNSPFLA